MNSFQGLRQSLFFTLLIGASLAVGWLIPSFYEWTGSDQSRPSPLILPIAIGLLLGGSLVCATLPWLPIEFAPPAAPGVRKGQFTIRTLFVATAAVAVVLVAFRNMPLLAVSTGLHGLALCYVARLWFLEPAIRWPVAAILACMYSPFAWLGSLNRLLPEMLWMAAGLPAFFQMMLISNLIGQSFHDSVWLSVLLTTGELLVGVWLIRLGPRRIIAYLVFVLLASTFGSFILNALTRM